MPSDPDPAGAAGTGGATSDIAAAVDRDGPLRFDRYMELALYGPTGFYASGGRAGRRGGDFITSPEVGPLFGTVLAGALDSWWDDLGRPDPFHVIDAGAGPGTLARSIRQHAGRCATALHVLAVEVSAAQRELHHPSVGSAAALPAAAVDGVIIANELLDNLPFRLLVFDSGWREAFIGIERVAGAVRLVEVLHPLAAPPSWLPTTAPHGARVPWQAAAAGWVLEARRVAGTGRVVVFDYITPRTAALAMQPWRSWLRTYRRHERGGHYLSSPGEQDITAQVALDQLAEPAAIRSQSQFLQRWGIDALVDEGRAAWAAAASAPTVAALAMRSRVREADALLDPSGLGAFTVVEWLGDDAA